MRFHPPVQQDLVQRKLFRVHYHLYATKDYLARKGGELDHVHVAQPAGRKDASRSHVRGERIVEEELQPVEG